MESKTPLMSTTQLQPITEAATAYTQEMLNFIDASPSPFHAVESARSRLIQAGFTELDERESWGQLDAGGRHFTIRGGGSLIAFHVGSAPLPEAGARLVGAHTDSPNIRLKPRLAKGAHGHMLFDVETYGGLMIATWVDRDLALAGRVLVADDAAPRGRRAVLVNSNAPVCRISTLAIHLNRGVNDEGLKLNKHKHLSPIVGQLERLVGPDETPSEVALRWVAELASCDPSDIVGHDLCLYDAQPGSIIGLDQAYLQVGRLDNLASSFHGLTALIERSTEPTPEFTQVLSLFDHEEVGSQSARGAQSSLLGDVLARLCGGTGESLSRCVQQSYQVSADMAHAVHPHYAELHDGTHQPLMNHGPVIKNNVNMRYATDGDTAAVFRSSCQTAGITAQEFVNRPDLACGSTIGSLTAAKLGLPTVDVGNPMWSMHSARETAGVADQVLMHRALAAFYTGA